ncbi:MAG TPA: hypothetical protein VEW69_00910 [Alphaproteobacteria bacterium]|nr:hypothetical protein [Alphaproteobacteria bacterium]
MLALALALFPAMMTAQTNCEDGNDPVNPAGPIGLTVQDVINRFSARESIFQQARNNYTYTQDLTVQTIEGKTVDGEFREARDITYDAKGAPVETVTYAPTNTLSRITLTKTDYDDIRHRIPFVLTTENLPLYKVSYIGQQHLDEIDTYVFDQSPKNIESGKRYFEGRVWVDNRDFQIVKTCGRTVPDVIAEDKSKNPVRENLSPVFVTYHEQIDGVYWFPTYARADEVLHFSSGDVHVREIIKYTKYKRSGSKTKIIFHGEKPAEKPAVQKKR